MNTVTNQVFEHYDKGFVFSGQRYDSGYTSYGWVLKSDVNGNERWPFFPGETIAGNTRKAIEAKSGRQIITRQNAKRLKQRKNKEIGDGEWFDKKTYKKRTQLRALIIW